MARQILYREFHGLLWIGVGLAAASVGAIVAASFAGYPARGGLVVTGIVGLLVAYVTDGIHRLNCITLAPDRLIVGRESFGRADIDGLFGVQPPVVLHPDEQSQVEGQWPVPPEADIRIAGGGWGRRFGTHMVVLREVETQQLVAIFSRHPRELDHRLAAWLGDLPGDLGGPNDPDGA